MRYCINICLEDWLDSHKNDRNYDILAKTFTEKFILKNQNYYVLCKNNKIYHFMFRVKIFKNIEDTVNCCLDNNWILYQIPTII